MKCSPRSHAHNFVFAPLAADVISMSRLISPTFSKTKHQSCFEHCYSRICYISSCNDVQEKATNQACSALEVLRPKEACRSNHPGIPARTTTSRQRERRAKGRGSRCKIESTELSPTGQCTIRSIHHHTRTRPEARIRKRLRRQSKWGRC